MSGVEYNLRPVWDAILGVFAEFERVCGKHGLRYVVAYGTTLGAIRHKGFIPWDDDFDVFMPRPDYQKFLEIAPSELPSHLKVGNRDLVPGMEHYFSKLMVSDRDLVEQVEKKCGYVCGMGIFIDIFPLDGFPRGVVGHYFQWFRSRMLYARQVYLSNRGWQGSLQHKVANVLGAIAGLLFPRWKTAGGFTSLHDQLADSFSFDSCGYCVDLGIFPAYRLKRMPIYWFTDTIEVPFESVKVRVPRDYDGYLTQEFGDYMQLPPVERRRISHGGGKVYPWRFG